MDTSSARRLSRVGAHLGTADAAGVLRWLSGLFGGEPPQQQQPEGHQQHEAAAAAAAAADDDDEVAEAATQQPEPAESAAEPPALEPGRFWIQGVAGYFNDEGFRAFQASALRPSDVVFVSYPKCGTSWMHQILFCLLRMDGDGELPAPRTELLGSSGQVYPDAVPVSASEVAAGDRGAGGRGAASVRSIEALMAQPEPRLFTTHIRGPNLPPSLQANGRLVVIARNPKDAIVSTFFFQEKLSSSGPPRVAEGAKPGLERGMEGTHEDFLIDIPEEQIPYGA